MLTVSVTSPASGASKELIKLTKNSDEPVSWQHPRREGEPDLHRTGNAPPVEVSDDTASSFAPIAVAQQAFVELAGGKPRQFSLEVDRAGTFDGGEVLAAKGDQLLGEIWARADTRHRLHNCLDLFAEILVGDAEHRRVGNVGMGDQQVLAFLRINVHPAGDDHECPPVGQIDVAFLVDIADIADRAHRAVS